MQTLGGYQMPSQGRIGGQKGVGTVEPTSQASVKRKRDDTGAAHVTGYLSYIRCTAIGIAIAAYTICLACKMSGAVRDLT